MSPLFDYECTACGLKTEALVTSLTMNDVMCPNCQGKMVKLMSAHSGYHIKGNNSASVRPKSAGSKKK